MCGGVSKFCVGLLWEEIWSRGLSGGGVSTGESGMGCTGSKLGTEYWYCLVPTGGCVFILAGRWGGIMPASFFFFLEKSPNDHCPSSTCFEISKQISFLPVYSRHFSNCCFYTASLESCCAVFLRAGIPFPPALLALSAPSALIFKVLDFKSC